MVNAHHGGKEPLEASAFLARSKRRNGVGERRKANSGAAQTNSTLTSSRVERDYKHRYDSVWAATLTRRIRSAAREAKIGHAGFS